MELDDLKNTWKEANSEALNVNSEMFRKKSDNRYRL